MVPTKRCRQLRNPKEPKKQSIQTPPLTSFHHSLDNDGTSEGHTKQPGWTTEESLMGAVNLRTLSRTVRASLVNSLRGEHKYPLYASFKITNRCGRTCSYCNVWHKQTEDALSTEDCFRVLDNMADAGVFTVTFEGGEPFFRNDMVEVLRHAAATLPNTALVTSLERDDFPLEEASQYLDNLHISIDEEHENLHLLDRLKDVKKRYGGRAIGAIQIVVPDRDLPDLERKVRLIDEAGFKAVLMPATYQPRTRDTYPSPLRFGEVVHRLKKEFPYTILTPFGFLGDIKKAHGCTAASIIVDADGSLFYPCRVKLSRAINLVTDSLRDYLNSDHAQMMRDEMKVCTLKCGWYQYFAVASFSSPFSHPVRFVSATRPYWPEMRQILSPSGSKR